MDDLVEKVENNRYDAALQDALRALVTVFGGSDPISVQQDDNGALNIEVKSQSGVDMLQDENIFAKKTPIGSAGGTKRRTKGHLKSLSSGNDDIAFVSPISSNRRDQHNISKESSCPGDETKEFANMVVEETSKKQPVSKVGHRRGSRTSARATNVEVLD